MKVAYITSSSFSGSTLLTFILNSHSKMGTISEFDIMSAIRDDPDYLCSCGDKIRQCKFFVELKNIMNNAGIEFELDNMDLMFNIFASEKANRYFTQKLPLFDSTALEDFRESILKLIPAYSRFMQNMHRKNEVFMQAVLKLQNADIFLDANKNPYRIKRLSERHEVLPIYVYKNGIAGAYSFYSKRASRKSGFSFRDACIIWFKEQITINRVMGDSSPKKALSISYGEMCGDTQSVVNKIYDLCEVEYQSISGFYDKPHHIIGNVMRVKNIDKIVETTAWKDNLGQKEIEIYLRIYDEYMPKLLGYNSQLEPHIWYGR
jgi:hypothetical protein